MKRVILFVKHLDAMACFYREGMGLTLVSEGAGWAEVDAGGVTLMLHAIPATLAARIVITRPPMRREDTPMKLVFEVEDLAAARAGLAAHGAVMAEPNSRGGCEGLDPEGNVFLLQLAAARI